MANPPDGASGLAVGDEVQRIGLEISQKFVPEPNADAILRDLFVALGRFKHVVRWKKFWLDKYLEEHLGNEGASQSSATSSQESEGTKLRRSERIRQMMEDFAKNDDGADDDPDDPRATGLRATKGGSNAPVADRATELFLKAIDRELIGRFNKGFINRAEPSDLDKELRTIMKQLSTTDNTVVVPTDKTNRLVTVPLDWYAQMIEGCVEADAVEVDKEDLDTVLDQAMEDLDEFHDKIAPDDMEFILTQMMSRAIPQCFGLIKDHQIEKKDENGNFPMRFVVPDNNFMSGFANVGYRIIKGIFDRNDVNYAESTILNAEHLKTSMSANIDSFKKGTCSMVVVLGGDGTGVGVRLLLELDDFGSCWCLPWFVDVDQGGVDPLDGWWSCHLRPEVREG